MFDQCLSSLALNWETVLFDTTVLGSEFQSSTTLWLKAWLRLAVLALGFLIFHSCPLVFRFDGLLKKSSQFRDVFPCIIWYTVILSPR